MDIDHGEVNIVINYTSYKQDTYLWNAMYVLKIDIHSSHPAVDGPSTVAGPRWPGLHTGEPLHGQQALPAAGRLISQTAQRLWRSPCACAQTQALCWRRGLVFLCLNVENLTLPNNAEIISIQVCSLSSIRCIVSSGACCHWEIAQVCTGGIWRVQNLEPHPEQAVQDNHGDRWEPASVCTYGKQM